MSLYLSMSLFALAASISPGPVNLLGLAHGVQYGFRASLRHVTGATMGFTLLLLLIGLGLHEVLTRWPLVTVAIKWAGAAFLLYMAWKLFRADGALGDQRAGQAPSYWQGALMQWLNPKAWLASVAGMGAFAGGDSLLVWQFCALYWAICYLSLACWAYAGAALGQYLHSAARIRLLNRLLAVLLLLSTVLLF